MTNHKSSYSREEIWQSMVDTVEELTLMTMGYPENRFRLDTDDYNGENAPKLLGLERWGDRYTPFHNEMFQNVRT